LGLNLWGGARGRAEKQDDEEEKRRAPRAHRGILPFDHGIDPGAEVVRGWQAILFVRREPRVWRKAINEGFV
jgi:hypothetical protein